MYMLQTSDEWMYNVLKTDEKITQQIIETNKISR